MRNLPKNAIWIISDQQPAHMLSCNGNPNLNTPNLDIMAAQGVNCTNAVSGYPLCCPFRGSMLTSRYPHKCVPGHEYPLDPSLPTVSHAFKEHGYHTAYIGKWHLDGFHECNGSAAMHIVPEDRRGGFDYWVGYENNNSQNNCWVHGGNGNDAFHYPLPGYETDCLTDILIKYLESQADKQDENFFAVLSVQPPHNPYVAPAEYMSKHNPQDIIMRQNVPEVKGFTQQVRKEIAGAYAMVENLDWNVGRIIATLKQRGLYEETNILFFADHGDMHGSHGQLRKTAPWEEAIRTPFIIEGAKDHYEMLNRDSDIVINHVDIAPTTLGLCGLPVPEYMKGFDYSGIRIPGKSQEAFPKTAFIQSITPTGHCNSIDQAWRAVVSRDHWKYVALPNTHWMLYNLNIDPYEQVNLAFNPEYKRKRDELKFELDNWIEKTGDVFPLP